MTTATQPKLAANAAPTASFKVEVDGLEASTQEAPNFLERLVVETHLDKIGSAQVTFAYNDGFKPSLAAIGGAVKISVGGSADNAFTGVITGFRHSWRGGREFVTVEAMDPLVKLGASRQTKVWGGATTDKIKDSDAASEVISGGGCTAGNVEATAGERPYIFQRNESNLAFLKRLAARNGYLVFASEGKVNFQKPQFSGASAEVSLQDIVQLDYSRSDAELPQSVAVTGWDYVAKKQVKGSSSDITAIGGGSTPSGVTFGADTYISDVFIDSDAGAKAMAEAEMNRLARTFVRGSCTTVGNGSVKIGGKVKFIGSFEGFNPEGLVVGVRHVIEGGSVFQTTFWFVGNTEPE
jgi:phage protein D